MLKCNSFCCIAVLFALIYVGTAFAFDGFPVIIQNEPMSILKIDRLPADEGKTSPIFGGLLRPFPLPAPEDDWSTTLAAWRADEDLYVQEDADTSCFAVLRASRSAGRVSCMAWNKSNSVGLFEVIRTHFLPSGRPVTETVVSETVGPDELRSMSDLHNIYPERGEDDIVCIIRVNDFEACTDDQVSLAMATRYDGEWRTPEERFEQLYCRNINGLPNRSCQTHSPLSLEVETRHPTDHVVASFWNRSYSQTATAVLLRRGPCEGPWSWTRYTSRRLEPRQVMRIFGYPDDPDPASYFKLVVLPDDSDDLYGGPGRADLIFGGALAYHDAPGCGSSNSDPDPVSEATEILYLTRQNVWSGYVPYVGTFPAFGAIDGELLEISAPADLLVRYGIVSISIPKAALGHDTADCGDPDKLVTLGPAESTSPADLADIFGSEAPPLPVTIAACASASITDGFLVELRYRYR